MRDSTVISPDDLDALLEKAESYLWRNEFAQAEKLAVRAVASPLSAVAHCILGACCSSTGRNDEALSHFTNSFTAAEAAANPGLQARALNGTAIVQRGDQHTAIH